MGLIIGLFGCLFWGLTKGLTEVYSKNIQERNQPNQGMINSFQNVMLSAILIFPIVPFLVMITLTSPMAEIPARFDLNQAEVFLLFSLPTVVLPVLLIGGGGMALIQHIALRATLFFNNHIPLNFVHFLNYAEQRMFVQRVGGGYIFIHRLLLEHFANLNLVKPFHISNL